MGRKVAIGLALVAAFAAGVAHLVFLFGLGLTGGGSSLESTVWILGLIATAIAVPGLLTALLPVSAWVFPLAFTACYLPFAVANVLAEPMKGLATFAIAAVIFALGFLSSRFVLRR